MSSFISQEIALRLLRSPLPSPFQKLFRSPWRRRGRRAARRDQTLQKPHSLSLPTFYPNTLPPRRPHISARMTMRFSTTPSRSVLIRIRVIIHSFRQDPSAVTVITIGGGGDTAASTSAGGGPSSPSTSPVVNLPTVLQDRKRRTSSGNNSGQQQQSSSSSGQHQPLGARLSGGGGGGGATALSAHRPDVADVVSSPASPEPRPGSSTAGEDGWKTDLLSWFGNRDAFCEFCHVLSLLFKCYLFSLFLRGRIYFLNLFHLFKKLHRGKRDSINRFFFSKNMAEGMFCISFSQFKNGARLW